MWAGCDRVPASNADCCICTTSAAKPCGALEDRCCRAALSGPRATLQQTERPSDPFQSCREVHSRLLVEVADRGQLVQQLERVPEVLTGRFRVGVSSGVAPTLERAAALGAQSPVYSPPQLAGNRTQDLPAGGDALVRAASTVGKQAPRWCVWPSRRGEAHAR
jgi:hypothetical protein